MCVYLSMCGAMKADYLRISPIPYGCYPPTPLLAFSSATSFLLCLSSACALFNAVASISAKAPPRHLAVATATAPPPPSPPLLSATSHRLRGLSLMIALHALSVPYLRRTDFDGDGYLDKQDLMETITCLCGEDELKVCFVHVCVCVRACVCVCVDLRGYTCMRMQTCGLCMRTLVHGLVVCLLCVWCR